MTKTEELVGDVWKRVLDVESVATSDDFFKSLGGHSLKATSVIAMLRRELGVKVPLRLIFDRPTLGDFAAGLDEFLESAKAGVR